MEQVISHQLYERYVLNTSAKERVHMRYVLALHEHIQEVTNTVTRHRLSEKAVGITTKSLHGRIQIPNCIAAPDTYVCCQVSYNLDRIIKTSDRLKNEDSITSGETDI